MTTTLRPIPLALALAGLATVALPGIRTAAAADLKGEVSVGFGSAHPDNPSARFGQYNGITGSKNWVFGNLNLRYKPDRDYVDFSGNNLGMDNQEVTLSAGRYGSYGLVLGQDKFASPIAIGAQTPFIGAGSDQLTLPASFTRNATTSGMTNLASQLKSTDLGLDRTTNRAGLFFTPTDRWRFEINAEQYSVQGKKPLAAAIGFTTTTFPAPVDEKTNIFGAALNYRGDRTQWSAAYKLSEYDNHFNSLTWDNPFSATVTRGRISLAPDNLQHTLSVTGAVNNLPLASRLTMNIERSRMEQNETFLPYTINSASSVPVALPRNSANIQVDNTDVNLNLSSRPLANLKTNLRYRFRDRDTDNPRALFLRVLNDNGNQIVANSTTQMAQYAFPSHAQSHQLKFDGSYSLGRAGTVKAGVQRDIEDRNDRAVTKSTEDTVFAGYSRRFGERAEFDIRVDHARRKADSSYDQSRVFTPLHTQAYYNNANFVANPALRFDNHPLARQFDIADRRRDKLGANYTLHVTESLNVGLHAQYLRDAYPDGQYGLRSVTNRSYTLDGDYTLPEDYSLYAFATRELSDYSINGIQFNGAPTSTGYDNAANNWTMENNDRIFTLGLGGTKRALGDKLRLKLGYSRSVADNSMQFTAGSNLAAPTALSAGKQTRDRIELRGSYEFMPRTTLGLGALYDRYQVHDWAVDGIAAGSNVNPPSNNLLTLVNPTNGYRAYTLYGQLGYRW